MNLMDRHEPSQQLINIIVVLMGILTFSLFVISRTVLTPVSSFKLNNFIVLWFFSAFFCLVVELSISSIPVTGTMSGRRTASWKSIIQVSIPTAFAIMKYVYLLGGCITVIYFLFAGDLKQKDTNIKVKQYVNLKVMST